MPSPTDRRRRVLRHRVWTSYDKRHRSSRRRAGRRIADGTFALFFSPLAAHYPPRRTMSLWPTFEMVIAPGRRHRRARSDPRRRGRLLRMKKRTKHGPCFVRSDRALSDSSCVIARTSRTLNSEAPQSFPVSLLLSAFNAFLAKPVIQIAGVRSSLPPRWRGHEILDRTRQLIASESRHGTERNHLLGFQSERRRDLRDTRCGPGGRQLVDLGHRHDRWRAELGEELEHLPVVG